MSKFTPGPWFTQREGFSSVYIEARIGGGLLQEVAVCGPTQEGPDQQEANALLIADAPALLDALEEIVICCGDEFVEFVGTELSDKARALIAKHRGVS